MTKRTTRDACTGGPIARLSGIDTKSGRLQRTCLDLLRQHERDGALPTSNRFIYYELVQCGIITKQKANGGGGRRSDQDMTEALFRLRDVGAIPWNWIVDETRSFDSWRYADSVASYVADTIPQARIDLWGGKPPPVIITESRSLAGVLEDLAYRYLVPITATNGQVGGHLRTEVAPRLCVGQHVLYLGDLDWQGGQIETNTRSVLERLVAARSIGSASRSPKPRSQSARCPSSTSLTGDTSRRATTPRWRPRRWGKTSSSVSCGLILMACCCRSRSTRFLNARTSSAPLSPTCFRVAVDDGSDDRSARRYARQPRQGRRQGRAAPNAVRALASR
jgi:hypothetical protein